MSDIILEIIRALTLLGLVIFLWIFGRGRFEQARQGWNSIIVGFGLLLFGSLIDITDNFESLNRFVIVGNTKTEAVLEKFVGFLGGFFVIAFGLIRWLPSVQRLSNEIAERRAAEEALKRVHQELELRVQARTAELQKTNETLKHEITVRKRAEDALINAKEEAEWANRAKSEFLATMSHELRTPLNAVIGFSNIMQTEAFGPIGSAQYLEYAKDINDSGSHLLNLINDILDLAKVESGKDELCESDIEIDKLIGSVMPLMRQRALKASVELVLEIDESLPALRADERKVKQILVNLLTNAIKFTESGGKVTLRARRSVESGCLFEVVDTGIGIAPDDIPKVFSQFGQVDNSLSRKYEGTGLGLPLTKALVELHNGSLDLQSKVGVGTTVTVHFPASRIEMSGQDQNYASVDSRKVIGGLSG